MISMPYYYDEALASPVDVLSALLSNRIIMLFDQITDDTACLIISQLLALEAKNPRADTGEVISTLQTAIMQILGIGCEKNLTCAQKLLKRALLWGEKPAAKILGFLWAEEGNRETEAFYEAVYAHLNGAADISSLLKKSAEGSKAAEYCVLIAAVQLIAIKIGGSHEIDIMFADQMNREEVPFSNKLAWISRYRDGAWMKGYLAVQASKKIGFLP